MESIALVRSVVSKEGDHQRGTYLVKTGYRPDPTAVHPSIGAICCHELPAAGTDIPRHISILPDQWPARGGFLGDELTTPSRPTTRPKKSPTSRPRVADPSGLRQRLADLDVLERGFARRPRTRRSKRPCTPSTSATRGG